MEKRAIHLQSDERNRLLKLIKKGHDAVNRIKRAYILLHSDAGRSDAAIAEFLLCSEDTVRRMRVRYLTEGLDAALDDEPHPGREPALNAQQEAYLIALACSNPPSGHERWTLELLTQRMLDDEQVAELSKETVRLTLKKTNSSLGV